MGGEPERALDRHFGLAAGHGGVGDADDDSGREGGHGDSGKKARM